MGAPGSVVVRVPAKINLHLSVGPLRADGYHELVNVFHAVDLCDDVRASAADVMSVTVAGAAAVDVPTDRRNLAWQAAAALAASVGRCPDVHLHIDKRIPVAGGMAGGSADAAAALLACARLWTCDVELVRLAGKIGSDVAFPLVGGTAVGVGRGELLTPVPTRHRLHWVLAVHARGISAGEAYRTLDILRHSGTAPAPIGPPEPLYAALAAGGLDGVDGIAALLGNDLQPAVLTIAPDLAGTLAAGTAAGALAALVCGSGPTCAFLCRDDAQARDVAAALDDAGVCAGTRLVSGPAPGAAVLS